MTFLEHCTCGGVMRLTNRYHIVILHETDWTGNGPSQPHIVADEQDAFYLAFVIEWQCPVCGRVKDGPVMSPVDFARRHAEQPMMEVIE